MSAPITPLGARTPHAHPALPWVIGVLALVIAAGVILVFMRDGTRDVGTSVPSASPSPTAAAALEYRNNEYGLLVDLPASWESYTIETYPYGTMDIATGESWLNTGLEIAIRHPQWTEAKPRQDIPIMVFTMERWNLLMQEKISVGAAPIPPSELARNSKYVFALPARYNYAFPEGWEEVQAILDGDPVSAFEPTP